MKKKTFIVQILDSKNPSRKSFTQVEDALFYSNDTDASLVFIPHEETFNFETAKVVMYNRDDESLVERDAVVTTENGRKVASYELPAEIIAHWGDWTAQPVFTSGGEIYSGSIVPFSVIRYLMHERPATLTEIVTVTEFIQQSQALVDDMEQAEAQRVSAESSRVSAESQRLSDEATRVGAETQRKIDHANRSAELAGKADKVVIKNLIENGDFSDGTNGWSNVASILTVTNNGSLKVENNGGASYAQVWKDIDLAPRSKYYFRVKLEAGNNNTSGTFSDWFGGGVRSSEGVYELLKENTSEEINTQRLKVTSISTQGDYFYIHNVQLFNLTQIFGVGNEPTKEEMDELIKVTGYIDGEYALNNKEMLGHLMNGKANKKQEDWITPTLLNGWAEVNSSTTPVRFMKDELGFVHLKGQVQGGTINVFVLPSGYRPADILLFLVYNANRMEIDTQGRVTPITTSGKTSLTGITFKAEG